MRNTFAVLIVMALCSCNQPLADTAHLQQQVDSLEKKLAVAYKPGLGEFMSSIQVHHAKLWFAGKYNNWKLADFELHEMMEGIEGIRQFETARKESMKIGMISPAMDSVNAAIQQKDTALFRSAYYLLTNTCNNCHHATSFEFNVVKVPDTAPFSNQDFSAGK